MGAAADGGYWFRVDEPGSFFSLRPDMRRQRNHSGKRRDTAVHRCSGCGRERRGAARRGGIAELLQGGFRADIPQSGPSASA